MLIYMRMRGQPPTSTSHPVANGHLAICKTLVNAGADLGLLDADGNTPIDSAFAEGHQQVVALLKAPAKV